jgi:hypothetical protein
MKKGRIFRGIVWAMAAIASLSSLSMAQLIMGQYEPEAPFRTWNTFPWTSAASLGRGETTFASAIDSSAALANPGTLAHLPKFTLTINSSFHSASFFKYGPVNTGIFSTRENPTQDLYALDFTGVSFRLKNWTFAFSVSLTELYNRPQAKYEYSSTGILIYFLSFTQKGILRNFHFSAGRRIGPRLSAGLGLNYAAGNLEREFLEQSTPPGYTITSRQTQDFRGYFLNGGVLYEISQRLRVAAVFRTPYQKKSENRSYLNYSAPAGKTDITILADSEDKAQQPLVLGIGASYSLLPEFVLNADISYFAWSRYSVGFFNENQERNFKDIAKAGIGMEYQTTLKIFGSLARMPLRIGLIYDPQPMREPNSTYVCFTVGNGIYWKRLRIDIGAQIGREWGSGNDLEAKRIALAVGFGI